MARPLLYTERMLARFSRGTFARIDAVLRRGEGRADFVRWGVDRELVRREAAQRRSALRRRSYIAPL